LASFDLFSGQILARLPTAAQLTRIGRRISDTKARTWRALSGSGTSAGHPGVSQMAQGGTEQKGAKTAVSIFHQDAEAREQVASMHQDRSWAEYRRRCGRACWSASQEADSELNAAAIELFTCASIMCSAAFQSGSSANDFSITSCNCRRSVALNCLGAAIAGKSCDKITSSGPSSTSIGKNDTSRDVRSPLGGEQLWSSPSRRY